ncbi:MAG TPA: nucleotide-binding protein [Methanocorpusculum sp.]|nr:nucleotide-binding protein [Methanocorpusculum sp.]
MAINRDGSNNRLKVILDTNALMIPTQFGVDLIDGLCELLGSYELLVPFEVIMELRGLSQGHGKDSVAARMGLVIASGLECLSPLDEDIPVDDKIIRLAQMFNAIVMTNDKKLKIQLQKLNIPVIVLRARSRFELIGM